LNFTLKIAIKKTPVPIKK